ncbi:hypothetical protein [Paraburkholderia sp. C35]|uniref:hypothetical protein n=1 Tax=Paraburkholderia sp. C35 TaxID=2126993 RepID=UPI000D69912A|nr:hypothetical protein [Paraburkholderia sp. C35]
MFRRISRMLCSAGLLVAAAAHSASPDLTQRIAQAVQAHHDPYICTGRTDDANSYTCGTPNIKIGRLVAALLPTLNTSAALSNTAGLPVKWVRVDSEHQDGILVFASSTAMIRTNMDSMGALVQLGFNTADCPSGSEVCAANIEQALESAGVQIRGECVHRGGKVTYEVQGSAGQPVLISWRPGASVPRTYMELSNNMTLDQSMTLGERCM